MHRVKAAFDQHAARYDASRRRLIPCYDLFYQTAVECIPFDASAPIRVLDLGSGTGLLSAQVIARYPRASCTLVDLSPQMLAQARTRLANVSDNNVLFVEADYANSSRLPGPYDVIVSSLSIHHLNGQQKRNLFSRLYAKLNAGGIFINADQVQGETAEIDRCYRERWLAQVRANGASQAELKAAFERMREDRLSTLSAQLAWLQQAGFQSVHCWFSHYSFVVYSGRSGK